MEEQDFKSNKTGIIRSVMKDRCERILFICYCLIMISNEKGVFLYSLLRRFDGLSYKIRSIKRDKHKNGKKLGRKICQEMPVLFLLI